MTPRRARRWSSGGPKLSIPCLLAGLASPSWVAAETSDPGSVAETRAPGFFLRLAIGGSVAHHTASADAHQTVVDGDATHTSDTRLSYQQDPVGFVGEVAPGWMPSRDGLAFALLYVAHPYPRADYGRPSGDVLGVNARRSSDVRLTLYGGLVSYYPSLRGPLHVGLAGGLATLRWDNPYARDAGDETRSTGFAVGPEAGLERPVGEGFWIGATVRVLGGRAVKSEGHESHVVIVPTLLLTVTYLGHGDTSGKAWVERTQ